MNDKQENIEEPQSNETSAEDELPIAEVAEESAGEPTPAEIAQLRTKAAERDQFLGQLQRLAADFANYQKRVAREKVQWADSGKKEILEAILPMLDNFKRALDTSENANAKDILAGFKMMFDQVKNALAEKNLKEILAIGQPFDPTFHEAVTQEYSTEYPDMTVMDEFQKGYMYQDSVLRHSKVKVSRQPETGDDMQCPDE